MSALHRWLDSALDLIFPPRCVHCKRAGGLLCPSCQQLIKPALPPQDFDNVLDDRRATALFDGPIQSAIHALKYENMQRMADLLAQRLAETLTEAAWRPTLITAVPLHTDRMHERGYNQSGLLAERLAQRVNLPFRADVITRTRATRPQVGLNYQDRQTNMADAFRADRSLAQGQAVIVIDDVYTTGATLRGCAKALREAGVLHVWALTVASASRSDAS